MAKKYIAICLCVLAVCAVFGLNARTDYEDIEIAIERIQETSDTMIDDLQTLQVLAYVVENFNVEATVTINGVVDPITNEHRMIYQSFWLDDEGMVRSESKSFTYENGETLGKVLSILKPLTWSKEIPTQGLWTEVMQALKAVVFVLGVIVSVIMFVIWFLLDAVLTAWKVVEMGLYILGFAITM